MKRLPTLSFLMMLAALLTGCAGAGAGSKAPADPRVQEVLGAMSAKLSAAHTLRFTGTRSTPSGFHAAVDLGESTNMTGVLRRPNQIVVTFNSSEGRRVLGYTGTEMILVDYKAHTHARSPAPPTGEGVLRAIDKKYNFVPPAAEFLTGNPQAYLMEGVTAVQHKGQDNIEGTVCDHLFFQQNGRTRDLWIATSDRLPRRITITYPNGTAPPIPITTTIHKWQINPPVTDADLAVNIPNGSSEVETIPLR